MPDKPQPGNAGEREVTPPSWERPLFYLVTVVLMIVAVVAIGEG